MCVPDVPSFLCAGGELIAASAIAIATIMKCMLNLEADKRCMCEMEKEKYGDRESLWR